LLVFAFVANKAQILDYILLMIAIAIYSNLIQNPYRYA